MSQHIVDHGTLGCPDLLRTGFRVRTQRSDGTVVLRLQGDLDVATAAELRRALAQALEGAPSSLVLDLAELSFVDSTGIGALVGASRRAREVGSSFVLRSPVRAVEKALRLTGVDQLLTIEPAPPLS